MKPADQPTPPAITPNQLRDARMALDWSPHRLAQVSRVTTSCIYGFEKTGRVAPLRYKPRGFDALAMMREVLERAGVEFVEENGGGPKVKLKRQPE